MNFELIKKYPLSTLLIVAIWVVCMIPVPETPLNDVDMIDKWTHFVMYGTLTITIWMEFYRWHHKDMHQQRASIFLCGCLMPIAMGGLVELAQKYLTTCRSGDWLDFVCNTLGVVLGMCLSMIIIGIIKISKGK